MTPYRGDFDSDARPFIRCVVHLPRWDIVTPLFFLVDTGASRTTIHPNDIVRAGIPIDAYSPSEAQDMTGVGGSATYGIEDAVLYFVPDEADGHPLKILVGPIGRGGFEFGRKARTPSLLGMDFIRQGVLTAEYGTRRLHLDMPSPRLRV